MFAHPKPHKPKVQKWEAVGTDAEFRTQLRDYRPEYEERLTWEFYTRVYDDVEAIWQHLLEAAKINPFDALSGGSQGFEIQIPQGSHAKHVPPASIATMGDLLKVRPTALLASAAGALKPDRT